MEAENCSWWACINSPWAESTISCQKVKLRVCSYHPAGSQITHFTQFSDFSAYKLSDALLGWWHRMPYDLASVVNSKYWCFSMLGSPFSFPHCIYWQSKGLCRWQKEESRLKYNLHPPTQFTIITGVGIMRTPHLEAREAFSQLVLV